MFYVQVTHSLLSPPHRGMHMCPQRKEQDHEANLSPTELTSSKVHIPKRHVLSY